MERSGPRTGLAIVVAIALFGGADARADGPAFDRPGIAFSPSTLPAHSFAWEQGLPDYQRDSVGGVTQRAFLADARLRYAFSDHWEVQLAAPLYEHVDERVGGETFTAAGTGDLSFALKFGLNQADGPFSLGVLGVVTFPSGQSKLSQGTEQYSLGATAGWSIGRDQSVAFYANVDVVSGDASWTFSPNWNFSLGDTVGGYVEAGYQPAAHGSPANAVAGGGLTWMARPTVQLDVYVDKGLTTGSTDLAAGCGVSVFVP